MGASNMFSNVSTETIDSFVRLGTSATIFYYFASIVAVSCLAMSIVSWLGIKTKRKSSPNFTILSCMSLALFFSAFENMLSSTMYSITWEEDQSTTCQVSVILLVAGYVIHLTAVLLFLYQRSELVRVSSAAKESRFVRVSRKVTLMATIATPPDGITFAAIFGGGNVYQGRCLMFYDPILPLLVLVLNTILSVQYLLLFILPLTSHLTATAASSTRKTSKIDVKQSNSKRRSISATATSSKSLRRMATKNMIMSTAAITTSLTTFIYNCLVVQGDPNFWMKSHLFGLIDIGANGVIMLCSTTIWIPDPVKKRFANCTQRFDKRSSQVATNELATGKPTSSAARASLPPNR